MVESRLREYMTMLKSRELKSTPQRVAMLRILEEMGHAEIEEIYNHIKRDFVSISLATVYKNINTMREAGLIQEIKVPERRSRFEIVKEPHSHFLCRQCGRIYDIPQPRVEELQLPEGFEPLHYTLTVEGICRECRATPEGGEKGGEG
ncbi:MAG: transcriptional repressor [Epsilonproteobacteria bacterium]|nr:transcriptional repressor [Campylobacterota bacterium]NPA56232.1 transcriptional repressor [Campylobacterota bacterium]